MHGLFGHPFKTWTGKKIRAKPSQIAAGEQVAQSGRPGTGQVTEGDREVLWPQDLLPMVIPDVKIYTYGHDASVDHILYSASHDTLQQKASTMLSDLADIRQTSQEVGRNVSYLPVQDIRHTYLKLVLIRASRVVERTPCLV